MCERERMHKQEEGEGEADPFAELGVWPIMGLNSRTLGSEPELTADS